MLSVMYNVLTVVVVVSYWKFLKRKLDAFWRKREC